MRLGVLLFCVAVAGISSARASLAQVGGPLDDTVVAHVAEDQFGRPEPVRLPRDEGSHVGYFVEWWQWWMHLEDEKGRRYGATVVFFSFPVESASAAAGLGTRRTDFRITDVDGGLVRSGSAWSSEPVAHTPGGFRLASAGQRAAGGSGVDRLHVEGDGYELDVAARVRRAPVMFFNKDGFIRTDPLQSARIYERQRMPTRGVLTKNGRRITVRGTTWMEHGWGNMPGVVPINWDFFHLELADGRDVALYYVRRFAGGPVFLRSGTVRDRRGRTTYLRPEDLEIVATGEWRRDATCTYPSGWRIRLFDQWMTVTPLLLDQEVRNPVLGHYWDGNATITGDVRGRAIAELLNYCQTPIPIGPGATSQATSAFA